MLQKRLKALWVLSVVVATTTPNSAGDIPAWVRAIDHAATTVRKVVTSDDKAHHLVSQGLTKDYGGPEWYRVHEESFDRKFQSAVSRVVVPLFPGVKDVSNSPTAVDSMVFSSGIILVQYSFPERLVNDRQKRGAAHVRVWISPDRQKAASIVWILRAGGVREVPRMKLVTPGGLSSSFVGEEFPGDVAFVRHAQMMISIALPEGHPGAGRDGVGFIRNNIVVEVQAATYTRRTDGDQWKTTGLLDADINELFAYLKTVDFALKKGWSPPTVDED